MKTYVLAFVVDIGAGTASSIDHISAGNLVYVRQDLAIEKWLNGTLTSAEMSSAGTAAPMAIVRRPERARMVVKVFMFVDLEDDLVE